MGAIIVEGEGGKVVNLGEYVSYPTYYYKWKRNFPNLKVSWLVEEDICRYCYAFANQHGYLANHTMGTVGNEDIIISAKQNDTYGASNIALPCPGS